MPGGASWLAGGFTLLFGLALLLWRDAVRDDRLSSRLRMVRHSVLPAEAGTEAVRGPPTVIQIVAMLGEVAARGGVMSDRTLEELRQTLLVSGFKGTQGLGLFVGAKLLLAPGVPMAVLALSWLLRIELPNQTALLALAGGMGLLAPDHYVRTRRKRYLRALEAGIPDALDMMVICGQAGLSMEASIERVGLEIGHAHPAVAEELTRTVHDMQVNADIREALLNFGRRTGLASARRLAGVMVQSIHYGTPLSQALRALSAEYRQEMLARYEAKAGRLPVLLTLPMIVFILPCVFLIVTGPAFVDVYRAMGK